jgi:PAS domain S-box-containing protein
MNAGGIIQSASDSVEQVFGWTPTELFGRNVKVLIPEPRRSALDRYLDRYRHADQANTLKRMRRFEAQRKDGTVFQIELSMSRADLPAHAAPFFIGIVHDVSREIDVGSTPDERSRLQHLITEQTRALATANLRLHLADRLASLGTLAAGLGHDMNNVLLPVRARLDALEHAGITAAALGHVTAVRQSIAYLQHLSDGLHFLALDPDGPGVAEDGEGTTDLGQWWGQVGALLRKAVPKHVKLLASLPMGLPSVRIAPHWLTQGMLNLIVNAGEALPAGRRPARIRVWARAGDDGKTIRLGVSDNGRGMAHSVQRRAFDLFFTTKPRSMGTGLGLPLARKVALRAGGTIELKSEAGKGTTVVMVLPAASHGNAGNNPRAAEKRSATGVGGGPSGRGPDLEHSAQGRAHAEAGERAWTGHVRPVGYRADREGAERRLAVAEASRESDRRPAGRPAQEDTRQMGCAWGQDY